MRTLEDLETLVEKEAREEGPAALADLQAQRERFRLAREIAEKRKASNLTQLELARRSGVPQSEISKIESGAVNASEVTLLRLLCPLGLTLGLVPATRGSGGKQAVKRAGKRPARRRTHAAARIGRR